MSSFLAPSSYSYFILHEIIFQMIYNMTYLEDTPYLRIFVAVSKICLIYPEKPSGGGGTKTSF